MVNIFEFSHVKEIVESWLVYVNKFSRIIKSGLLTEATSASFFSYFLELLCEKKHLN